MIIGICVLYFLWAMGFRVMLVEGGIAPQTNGGVLVASLLWPITLLIFSYVAIFSICQWFREWNG